MISILNVNLIKSNIIYLLQKGVKMMNSNIFKFSKIFIFLILIIFSLLFWLDIKVDAASVEIPYFISIFSIDSNFQTTPISYLTVLFSGGLKTNIDISFSLFYSPLNIFNVEDTDANIHTIYPALELLSLSATISKLLDFIDISFFVNDFEKAGSGGSYNTFYYTLNPDKDFSSVYDISGYGVSIKTSFMEDLLSFSFYAYQPSINLIEDSTIDAFDLAFKMNVIEDLYISIFFGTESLILYRWSISMFFEKKTFSILLTLGMPDTRTYTDLLSLYLLLEQNFRMQNFYECFSIFSKPEVYNGEDLTVTGESQELIMHFDIGYKDQFDIFASGLLTKLTLSGYNLSSLYLIPYVKLLSSGILWRLEASFDVINISSFFINIKLSFETSF